MPDSKLLMWLRADHQEIIHSVGTAVAVVVSLLAARLVRLPEAYWASITTLIVMLIAHTQPTWIIAIYRLLEISVGIAVGLVRTAVWREPQPDGV
jgi:uncharacterized membrane protein YgaE (UPF0421/DUF939 family)